MPIEELIKGLQCYRCGHVNSYDLRTLEYAVTVSSDTVLIPITIGQCHVCGEQLMDNATTTHVFAVRQKLVEGETDEFVPVGQTYRAK